MHRRRFRVLAALVHTLLLPAAACGSTGTPRVAATSAGPSANARGQLTVLAAASLTESFNDELTSLKTIAPRLSVTFSFGGSGALVVQVQSGVPADVIATADTASMKKLVDASLVEAPQTLAQNSLEILVAPGNPKRVAGLADLARGDLKVVLDDETVPAGKYAAQVLGRAGVTVKPVSKELDVKSAVAKVTSGEADATIVYVTDVTAAGGKGAGVRIPDAENIIADYPIAVVKASKNHEAAVAFVDEIVKGSGQAALKARGFLPGV